MAVHDLGRSDTESGPSVDTFGSNATFRIYWVRRGNTTNVGMLDVVEGPLTRKGTTPRFSSFRSEASKSGAVTSVMGMPPTAAMSF